MYANRAISPSLFQWESQNVTSEASPTGQRSIHHRQGVAPRTCSSRESKEDDRDLGTPPYLYAGPTAHVSHTGERSMRVIWKLNHELPAGVFATARVAAG